MNISSIISRPSTSQKNSRLTSLSRASLSLAKPEPVLDQSRIEILYKKLRSLEYEKSSLQKHKKNLLQRINKTISDIQNIKKKQSQLYYASIRFNQAIEDFGEDRKKFLKEIECLKEEIAEQEKYNKELREWESELKTFIKFEKSKIRSEKSRISSISRCESRIIRSRRRVESASNFQRIKKK